MYKPKDLYMKNTLPENKIPLVQVVGANIKALRLSSGLTQQDLAQTLGIEVETVSRYERGLYTPPVEQLEKIARALGVVAWTLMVSNAEEIDSMGLQMLEQIRRLSDEDAKTIGKIVKTYVDAHGKK
jgi:transcriptional regulator with XRE-family HTH domain